jgi:cytochrome c1
MPAGLLDKLADRDLADLYAYLRQPAAPRKRRRRCPMNSARIIP